MYCIVPTFRIKKAFDAKVLLRQSEGVVEAGVWQSSGQHPPVKEGGTVGVEKGIEGQTITPAGSEVTHIHTLVPLERQE